MEIPGLFLPTSNHPKRDGPNSKAVDENLVKFFLLIYKESGKTCSKELKEEEISSTKSADDPNSVNADFRKATRCKLNPGLAAHSWNH